MKFLNILLLSFAFLTACDQTEDETPIVYPVVYEKTDYDFEEPLFWLIEERFTTSAIAPGTRFADHVSYLETEEYPDIFESFYSFEVIKLLSDTTVDFIIYDPIDEFYDTIRMFYEQTIDQIILRDSQNIFEYSIDIDEQNNRLVNCDVFFTNTYFDQFSNQIEYTGFDGSPCNIYPSDDLVSGYLTEVASNISVGDTLAQINISAYFNKQ